VEAFRAKDKARILAESDTLATLVTDLHNPLALTDNTDGQEDRTARPMDALLDPPAEVAQSMNSSSSMPTPRNSWTSRRSTCSPC
jgi:hypothetical protein